MTDDDKKKVEDYSELTDLFGDTGTAPSLDDLLKDLGSDTESSPVPQKKAAKSKKVDTPPDPDFDALFADSPSGPLPPKKSKEGIPTGAEFDALFADSPNEPLPPKKLKANIPSGEEFEALFADNTAASTPPKTPTTSPDPFGDMNADFPEEKPGQSLSDDALFDYEPQSEASFEDIGGAEPELGDIGMADETPPPAKKSPDLKRIAARLGVMLVLALMIYGGLKFFLGEKPVEMAEIHKPIPAVAAAKPVRAVAPVTQRPEVAVTPIPEVVAATPSNLPVPGSVTSGLPSVQPTVTIPSTGMMTEMVVPGTVVHAAAQTPEVVSTGTLVNAPAQPQPNEMAAPATTDVSEKLDKLEMALQSIDQRLSQVGTGAMTPTEQAERLDRLSTENGTPGMQATLESAVKKMQALDTKLDRINELQQQVRLLNSEVQGLKEDVVTQTNIVGQQQRAINENTQASHMREPSPVKMMVQAIIPGRAWLRSERGELITVIPGDEVPGYGRVVSIDAASGSVVTSTRAVFREQ